MSEAVLDASALIAFLRKEPGADRVKTVISQACISAVNLEETLTKMVNYTAQLEPVVREISRLQIPVFPFDAELAHIAASMRPLTRVAGLSLGDRACLALVLKARLPALTTEKEWHKCDVGVRIINIR